MKKSSALSEKMVESYTIYLISFSPPVDVIGKYLFGLTVEDKFYRDRFLNLLYHIYLAQTDEIYPNTFNLTRIKSFVNHVNYDIKTEIKIS